MKLSRKQKKLKNRNLREKRKRNIERKRIELKRVKVKAKEELENTIKSSLTTSSYGCEVVKEEELPSFLNRLVSTIGLNKVIKVPRRKRGMTSSGKVRHCHPNVQLLVDTIGGERLVGYEVDVCKIATTGLYVELISHSVWITPEGKLADCTQKDSFSTGSFLEMKNKYSPLRYSDDFQYFIPVSKKDVLLKGFFAKENYQKHGYEIGLFPKPMLEKRWNNPTMKDLVVYGKGMEFTMGKDWKSGGSFSLPSTATGKYLLGGRYKI